MERVELHIHTKMSQMDGINTCSDYLEKAKECGMTSLAITDHGVVQAFPEAQRYLENIEDDNFKVIYGMESYYTPSNNGKDKSYHISILAKNQTGLENLYKIVSISNLNYFYKRPRILKELLEENREGLLIGSACNMGELQQAIIKNKTDEELEQIANNYDYLEIQPIYNNETYVRKGEVSDIEALKDINRKIVKLGEKLNKLVVATSDVHFMKKEDGIYRRILQSGQGYRDAENQPPLYFRTTEEMLEEFSYLGQDKAYEVVVTNTNKIADMCERITPIPKGRCYPHMAYSEDEICHFTYDKACELYEVYCESERCFTLPEFVKKRLDRELNSIIENGYASLYMIAQNLVTKSNEDGYIVGNRGAVASSLVAYFLGITQVNPLPPHYRCSKCEYLDYSDYGVATGIDLPDKICPNCGNKLIKDGMNIPFEVFAGLDGDREPDIDLNVSGEYQATAQQYVKEIMKTKDDSLLNIKCLELLKMMDDESISKINKDIITISSIKDMICTLGLIVSHERNIQDFIQKPYYKVIGEFGENKSFKTELKVTNSSKMFNKLFKHNGFVEEELARRFVNLFNGNIAKVINVKMGGRIEMPPLLFNLTEIQNVCTEKFKLTPDETLNITQELYENKLITNPKTESNILPIKVAETLSNKLNEIEKNLKDANINRCIHTIKEKNYFKNVLDEEDVLYLVSSRYINSKEFDCAIIPTGEGFENYENLSDIHKKVYKLIVKSLLAIFYPYSKFKTVTVTMSIANEEFTITRKDLY